MNRRHIIPALVLAGVGLLPPSASTAKTVDVAGHVDSACSISAAQPTVTVSRAGGSTVTFTPPSPAVTVSCNKANGTLSVRSSQLILTTNTNDKVNYTLRVAGWAPSPIDYTTSASNPPAQTGSNPSAGSATLVFSCNGGCTTGNINNNKTYNATLTLGISASP